MVSYLAAGPMGVFSVVAGIRNWTGLLICCTIAVRVIIKASKIVLSTLGCGNRIGHSATPLIRFGTGNQTGYGRLHNFVVFCCLINVFLVWMRSTTCEAREQIPECDSFPKNFDRAAFTVGAPCCCLSCRLLPSVLLLVTH